MDFLQLKYFLAAAEYEHITKAANSLHIAQPALSQSIKHLETELGVSLFDRKNRSIHLNSCGKLLQSEIVPIIKKLDLLPEQLKEMDKQVSHTISLNILAGTALITQSIISFKKLHPEVNFRLTQNADEIDSDLYISCTIADSLPDDGIQLLKEKILIAVPKSSRFAPMKSISLKQIKDEGFISFSGSKPFRVICDNYCKAEGIKPKIVFESDNQESIKNLVYSNLGVAFWPEYAWGKLSTKSAVLVPIGEPDCSRILYYKQNSHFRNSQYVKAFLNHLTRFIAKVIQE